MRSVMEHTFSRVPTIDIPRSSFDRSHGHKTTFDADFLVPILVDDIIPGDTFTVNANIFARLTSPTVLPVMDNMFLDTFFFFVPYRILWDNWEKFLGSKDNPTDSIDFTIPTLAGNTDIATGDLGDYLGLPIGYTPSEMSTVSALPVRAYRMIWNEWFRDQNLQSSLTVPTDNGPDILSETGVHNAPLKRGKRHDYFTSCLPFPQKGTAVDIPVTGTIPIRGTAVNTHVEDASGTDYGALVINSTKDVEASVAPSGVQPLRFSDAATEVGLEAVVTAGGLGTINDLRLAFQTQRLLERDARSGTRYVETLKAHWGVQVPDYRLQRPEYLGGGSTPIQISPVAQTTYQGTQTVEDGKGALAGIGTVGASHGFTTSFVEHGVLIGLMNVRSDITYSQGIERTWEKQTRYDFYYPVLSQIGEQAVLNREIFFNNTAADDEVFGYQERYAEYRYKPSRLSGKMRPAAPASLSAFNLSEQFTSRPTLGNSFITSNTGGPLDDVISVPSEPQFVADIYFEMNCARPMPLYGVPGNMDHL